MLIIISYTTLTAHRGTALRPRDILYRPDPAIKINYGEEYGSVPVDVGLRV